MNPLKGFLTPQNCIQALKQTQKQTLKKIPISFYQGVNGNEITNGSSTPPGSLGSQNLPSRFPLFRLSFLVLVSGIILLFFLCAWSTLILIGFTIKAQRGKQNPGKGQESSTEVETKGGKRLKPNLKIDVSKVGRTGDPTPVQVIPKKAPKKGVNSGNKVSTLALKTPRAVQDLWSTKKSPVGQISGFLLPATPRGRSGKELHVYSWK